MKINHRFLLIVCILFCAQIIQADLIQGLLGVGDNSSSSSNPPAPSPSPVEANHPVNSDKPTNNNDPSPVPVKTPPSSSPPTLPSSPSTSLDASVSPEPTPTAKPNNNNNSNNNTPTNQNDPPYRNHSPGNASPPRKDGSKNTSDKQSDPDVNSDSDIHASASSTPTSATTPFQSTPSSDNENRPHGGTIAGAVVGGIVGIALIGGLVTWCNRQGGCAQRGQRKNNAGFKEAEDASYSIDMRGAPVTPFEHSRRLMPSSPPSSAASPVPAYVENYPPVEQEYHQPGYAEYPPPQHGMNDTGYYYQQEPAQWDQHYSTVETGIADSHTPYYHDPYHKPDAADHTTYKPNAM